MDAHFRDLALEWIAATRSTPRGSSLRKLAYVFAAPEISLNYSYAYYALDEPTLLRWLVVGAWLLVPLGLLGFGRPPAVGPAAREPIRSSGRWGFALWALVVPVYALSVAVFFVSARYRLPLLVPLAAGAGFALVRAVEAARARAGRRLAAYAAALAALFALALWPHGLDDGRSEERTVMLLWLVDNGQGAEALRRLPAVEAAHPEPARLLLRLGRALDENREAGRGRAAARALAGARPLARRRPASPSGGPSSTPGGRQTRSPTCGPPSTPASAPRPPASRSCRRSPRPGSAEEAAARLERLSLPPRTDAASLLVVGNTALQLHRPDLALRFLDRRDRAGPAARRRCARSAGWPW